MWNFGKFDLWWALVTSILTWPRNDLINVVELDKSFLTLFLILARSHSFGDLWGGRISAPPPSVRSWPRPPSVRGLILSCHGNRAIIWLLYHLPACHFLHYWRYKTCHGKKQVWSGSCLKTSPGEGNRFCISMSKSDWAPWSSPRTPRRVQNQWKTKTSTPDLKPELCTFELAGGSLMPEMGPLITRIGRLRRVYDPLRFKNVNWSLYQT